MHRLATLLAFVAALALAGCTTTGASSSKKFTGTAGDVAKAVSGLQSAAQRKNADKICTEVLARSLVERLDSGGTTCKQEVEKAIADADEFTVDIRDVKVSGTTATATVRQGKDGAAKTIELVKEGNSWRVSGLSNG